MYKDVQSEMVKFPYVASSKMKATDAIVYMKECKIRHLPVMEQTKLVGVVSERDLLALKEGEDILLEEIMTKRPFIVHQDESLSSVVNIMAEKKYGCTLILNNDNNLIGIFTTIDALRLLEKFLEGDSKFYNSYENVIQLKEVAEWI